MKKNNLRALSLVAGLTMFASVQAAYIEVVSPNPAKAWVKSGVFVSANNLRQMGTGMTSKQVRALLGTPHFNEGFGLNQWNYIINFKSANGEAVSCQYQVQFNHGRTSGTFWNTPECADHVK